MDMNKDVEEEGDLSSSIHYIPESRIQISHSEMILTKNGTPRKRRPPISKAEKESLLEQKKLEKLQKIIENGLMSCESSCGYHCTENISHQRRLEILEEYFNLRSLEARKIFVLNLCERLNAKEGPKNKIRNLFIYNLFPNKHSKQRIRVCKRFFISTLGYSFTSVGLFYNLLAKTPNNGIPCPSRRGKCGNVPSNKFRHRDMVVQHINSYEPKYKGKKGPNNRRYLPKSLSAKSLHQDFVTAHPNITISYRSFCTIVKQENIAFSK